MAQEVFKRTEKKYMLDREAYVKLLPKIEEHMKKDRYYESEILSLYYDTLDFRLIRASIEKPAFKEKIRLRCYGVPDKNGDIFLEIKRKYKGVVYKRRSVMPLDAAPGFSDGEQLKGYNPQIESELKWAFDFYPQLEPRMLICCHRYAFSGKDNNELRITLDDSILFRDRDLDPSKGIFGSQLLKNGSVLMEIKIPGSMPLWLSHILDELKIYPTSYSKYANAYMSVLSGRDKVKNVQAAV